MGKLLRSNLSRLWKDKIFWLCMGGMLLYAVVYMLNASQKTISPVTGEVYTLEHYYFMFLAYVDFFFAVVTSMFLGTEYSDGTIRNKLIVGHTRTNVYLANLIVTFVASLLIMCVVYWRVSRYSSSWIFYIQSRQPRRLFSDLRTPCGGIFCN